MNIKMLKVALAGLVLTVSAFANAGLITLVGDAASDVDTPTPTLVNIISTSAGTITDLNLFIDFDANCCAYDNTLILSHIDTGTSAIIWVDSDTSGFQDFGDVRNTTFDDEASIAFVNAPLSSGTFSFNIIPGEYRPSDLLSIFDGESLLGTWQLSIQNTGCCHSEGDDLLAWSITADVTDVPEPSTLAIFALGMIGLASRRFKK